MRRLSGAAGARPDERQQHQIDGAHPVRRLVTGGVGNLGAAGIQAVGLVVLATESITSTVRPGVGRSAATLAALRPTPGLTVEVIDSVPAQ
ncbi:hypothetical protein MAHJHV55_52750 [Mycobacterium avium subsp. hominissuis]